MRLKPQQMKKLKRKLFNLLLSLFHLHSTAFLLDYQYFKLKFLFSNLVNFLMFLKQKFKQKYKTISGADKYYL